MRREIYCCAQGSNTGVGEQGCQLALPASLVHWPLPGEYWRADHCVKNYLSLPFIPSQAISSFIYLFLYFETRSPQITYADLEFKMCLPQSLKDWDYRRVHHTQLACFLSGRQRSGGRELPLPRYTSEATPLEPKGSWGRAGGIQGKTLRVVLAGGLLTSTTGSRLCLALWSRCHSLSPPANTSTLRSVHSPRHPPTPTTKTHSCCHRVTGFLDPTSQQG